MEHIKGASFRRGESQVLTNIGDIVKPRAALVVGEVLPFGPTKLNPVRGARTVQGLGPDDRDPVKSVLFPWGFFSC